MEQVSSVHPTGKFPEKVENLKRWSRFRGWNFRTECRVPFTFLVVCTSSRSTFGHRDVTGFTTKWNNFLPIGNSTFAPTEISGFFFLNGKRLMFSVHWFDYSLKDCVLSAMYREFGFRNTGSFCLWESGIREIWVVESWILGFGFQNTAHGIQNPTDDGIRNPESKFPDKKWGIQYMECGIQVLGIWK